MSSWPPYGRTSGLRVPPTLCERPSLNDSAAGQNTKTAQGWEQAAAGGSLRGAEGIPCLDGIVEDPSNRVPLEGLTPAAEVRYLYSLAGHAARGRRSRRPGSFSYPEGAQLVATSLFNLSFCLAIGALHYPGTPMYENALPVAWAARGTGTSPCPLVVRAEGARGSSLTCHFLRPVSACPARGCQAVDTSHCSLIWGRRVSPVLSRLNFRRALLVRQLRGRCGQVAGRGTSSSYAGGLPLGLPRSCSSGKSASLQTSAFKYAPTRDTIIPVAP